MKIARAAPGHRLPTLLLVIASLFSAYMPATAGSLTDPLPLLVSLGLELRIDPEHENLEGTAALMLRNVSDGHMERIPLLLGRLMTVRAVRDHTGGLVFRQRVAVFAEKSIHQVLHIEIDLAEPLPPGASTKLFVDYGGHLVGYTETGMLYVRDRITPEFTILREEAGAFPMPGTLSIDANRTAPRGEFDFDIRLSVPEGLMVALGGELVARDTHDGLARFHYRSIAPALFVNICIAPYRVVEDDGVRLYYFAEDEDGAYALHAGMQRAAARFNSIFGPPRSSQHLHIMQIPPGFGSQASIAAGIILDSAAFRSPAHWREAYHELSHLWNAVDLEGLQSARWNEGLATFFQFRLARELDGWEGETGAWERISARLLERCPPAAACARVPMRDYGHEHMTGLSYSVGTLMFAVLYSVIGEEAFDRALRLHFDRTRAAGTRVEDLAQAFAEVGGAQTEVILADWLWSTAWLQRLRAAGSMEVLLASYAQ